MQKSKDLERILRGYGKLSIALSGGVDSSVLLAFAAKILAKDNVLALIAKTPYMMQNEIDYAIELCNKLSVKFLIYENTLSPKIENNPIDRCYICKFNLFENMLNLARENGFSVLADGTNFDDLSDFRLGMKALKELNIASPLLEAKFSKIEIRQLAKTLGLNELVEKVAASCLMTRFEVGAKITLEDLQLIAQAENYLRQLGFNLFRVRKHNNCARLELGVAEFDKIFEDNNRQKINTKLKDLGFKFVSLDLSPYKMGNMNQ